MVEEKKAPKKFKIETPMGNLESDSGNHFIDILSVVGVILVLFIGKKIIGKYFSSK